MKKPFKTIFVYPCLISGMAAFSLSSSARAADSAAEGSATKVSPSSTTHSARDIKIRGKFFFPEGYPPGDVVVLYLSKGDTDSSQKSPPKTWTIDQKNYQFSPTLTVAKPQDILRFKNSDPDLHTVVSHSGPLKGQTITTLKGQSHSVNIKETGYSEILCGIHAQMRADLLVIPTRNFLVSRADGSFEGTFKRASFPLEIQIWHPILVSPPLTLTEASKNGSPLQIRLTPQN